MQLVPPIFIKTGSPKFLSRGKAGGSTHKIKFQENARSFCCQLSKYENSKHPVSPKTPSLIE